MAHKIFDNEFYKKGNYGRNKPLLNIGEGDCSIYFDVLSDSDSETIFYDLNNEINWGIMRNKGKAVQRLVAIQGTLEKSKISNQICEPLYRHPADEQPLLESWTENVNKIRTTIENDMIKEQSLNHCLIQLYRSGTDLISEHADKTLDIQRYSNILNYSCGATRVMTLRSKEPINSKEKKYRIHKVTLPHNSVFILGWKTNLYWKHSIKQDKRIPQLKSPDELRDNCQRISLTFRSVSTFIRREDSKIFGQGAKIKTEEELETKDFIIKDKEQESLDLLKAFSVENHKTTFDWDEYYGKGFNILNFSILNDNKQKK